mgnify:CR=1 FL=1
MIYLPDSVFRFLFSLPSLLSALIGGVLQSTGLPGLRFLPLLVIGKNCSLSAQSFNNDKRYSRCVSRSAA